MAGALMAIVDWERANCWQAQAQPELFEEHRPGEEDSHVFRMRIGAALRYCRGCPVREACLRVALEEGLGGVRGGRYLRTTECRTHRRAPAAPCGTAAAIRRHRKYGETCPVCHVGTRAETILRGIA